MSIVRLCRYDNGSIVKLGTLIWETGSVYPLQETVTVFDPALTYPKDTMVFFNDALYISKDPVSPGPWTLSHWEIVETKLGFLNDYDPDIVYDLDEFVCTDSRLYRTKDTAVPVTGPWDVTKWEYLSKNTAAQTITAYTLDSTGKPSEFKTIAGTVRKIVLADGTSPNELPEIEINPFILEKADIKVIALGDSFTDSGDSSRTANGSYYISTRGYWVCALAQSSQRFNMLDAVGVSGNTTVQILARITDVTAADADIVLLLAGTNDLNQGRSPEDTAATMASILDAIITAGKKVILTPISKRRTSDGLNDKIDTTNTLYRALAVARKAHVVMADESAEFNDKIIAGDTTVSTDGLHPSSYGAWILAKPVATAIDTYIKVLPSPMVNYVVNPSLSGDTGSVLNGATGKAPTNWRIYYADPTNDGVSTGLGCVNNGDGSVTVTTGNSTTITNGAKALFRSDSVTIPDQNKEYALSFKVTATDLSKLTSFRIYFLSNDTAVGSAEFQVAVPAHGITMDNLRLQSPFINIKTATKLDLFFVFETNGTGPITVTISEPELLTR
jgi:lysophospholipase L1-like esterase